MQPKKENLVDVILIRSIKLLRLPERVTIRPEKEPQLKRIVVNTEINGY